MCELVEYIHTFVRSDNDFNVDIKETDNRCLHGYWCHFLILLLPYSEIL